MKLLLLISLLLSISIAKELHTYIEKNDMGELSCRFSFYKDDSSPNGIKRHGKYESWHKNGQLAQETHYVDGVEHGSYKYYTTTGELDLQATNIDGQKQGFGYKYDKEGRLKEIYNYKDDKLNGYSYLLNVKGDTLYKTYYLNNKIYGDRTWYKKGKPWKVDNYINGKKDGFSYSYTTAVGAPKITVREMYKNGIPIYRESVDSLDKKLDSCILRKGRFGTEIHGPFIEWWKNGIVKATGNYQKNFKEGEVKKYSPEGKHVSSLIYKRGKIVEGKSYGYRNGIKRSESNWLDSKLNGDYITFDKAGRIVAHGVYKNGKEFSGEFLKNPYLYYRIGNDGLEIIKYSEGEIISD